MLCVFLVCPTDFLSAEDLEPASPPTTAEVLAGTTSADWRTLDPERTLYMKLRNGLVVIELATDFAPAHVKNLLTLAAERYFDDLAVVRSQDNYVAQWGDPNEDAEAARSLGNASVSIPAELDRPFDGLLYSRLGDRDVYAPEVGFSAGFPVGRDPTTNRAWLLHCYGMVGVGRGNEADSGNGSSLYAVTGHAPRHLDRNITLIGRVVVGMELLTTLPRGEGEMGFYEHADRMPTIEWVRSGSEIRPADRVRVELLKTTGKTFEAFVESRRYRREPWFFHQVGHVEVCNVPLPTREQVDAHEPAID